MNARKRMSTGAVVAAVALLGGAIFGGTADAQKKKKKGGGSATVTKTVNAPVPDAIGNGVEKVLDGKLATTLTVGKAGKNKSIGRVAVTLQTTGLAAGAAGDLDANITAPDGTTVGLFGGLAGQSIGPLTIQPNSPSRRVRTTPRPRFRRRPHATIRTRPSTRPTWAPLATPVSTCSTAVA